MYYYMLISTYCRNEVHTYDEHNYEYLTEVVNTIWEENAQTLNFANMPENVHITEGDSSKKYFKCVLDAGHIVASDPFVEVHISDNSDIEITHYTKSQYVGDARSSFAMFYILWCLFCFLVMMAGWWLIKLSIYILCIAVDFVVRLHSWLTPQDTEKAK